MATELGSLAVSLSLNADSFNGTISQVNQKMKAMGNELKAVQAKGKDFEQSIEGLKQKQDILQRSFDASSVKLQEQRRRYDELVASGKATEAQLNRAANEVNKAQAEYNKLERQLKQVSDELDKQTNKWNQAGQSLESIGGRLQSIGGKLTGIGTTLTASVTAPIVAMGAASVKTAMDFEAQMDRVGAIAGATAEDMQALTDTALELGASTSKSASEVAMGMENMAAMGFTANEIMAAMPGIISAAEASGADMAQTADVVSAALNIWGLEASETSRIADVLAQTANQSAADITDMQYALKYAGPPAAALGVSMEELSASIGIMTNAGMKGEQAGTTLRSALLSLLDPSEENSKLMSKMGIEITDAQGNFVGLANLVDNLTKSMEGQTDTQKAATLASLVGTEAVSGMLSLMAAGPAEIEKMTSALKNSGGASAEAAAKMKDNLKGTLDELMGTIETAAINIGTALSPAIEKIAEVIQKLVEKFQNLSPFMQGLSIMIAGIAAAIGPVILAVGLFANSIGSIMTVLAPVVTAIGEAGGLLAALTGPIGIVIGAIALLGGAFALAWTQSEEFRTSVTEVFTTVKDVITTAFGTVKDFLVGQFTEIKSQWDSVGPQFGEAVANVFNAIKAVVEFVMPAVLFIVDMAWTAIKQVISGAIDIIMGVIKVFSGLFTGDFSRMWEGIKQIFLGAIDLIIGWMTLTFVGGLKTLLTNFAKAGLGLLKGMWDDIAKAFTSGISSVQGFVSNFVTKTHGFFKNLMNGAINIFVNAWRQAATYWQTFTNIITNIVKSLYSSVISLIKALVSGFLNIFSTLKTTVSTIFTAVKEKILSTLKSINLIQIGKDIISGLINGIGSMLSNLWEKIKSIGEGIPSTIKKILGIKSPSRVMMQVGKDTVDGLVLGLSENQKYVDSAMSKITKRMLNITKQYSDDEKKITSDAKAEIAKINERATQDIEKIERNAKEKKRKLTQDELIKIERIEENAAEKIVSIQENAQAKKAKLLQQEQKEKLEMIENFIENKKSLEELNSIQEAAIWQKSVGLFKAGTEERIKAQNAYKDALEVVNSEIVSINEKYQGEMQRINDDLKNQEEQKNKEYNDALNNRIQTLTNFAGLFEAFKTEVTTTGTELLGNLQSQVDGFKLWQSEIDKLASKGIDGALLEELRAMGPDAVGQIQALNTLTEPELQKYSDLYREKSALAREQAITELSGMKTDTEMKIDELRKAANAKLDTLKIEWTSKIRALTSATSTELSSLQQIGIDAGTGLLNGLASMEGPLITKATEIANAIKSTIQSALDIHSPSRVMRGFGINIGQGLVLGMDDMVGKVAGAAQRLATTVSGNVATSTATSNSYDYSKNFAPSIQIYTRDSGDKAMERTLRRLAYQF